MNINSPPVRLFHGTPNEIHISPRPFLDPRLAGGYDEGDPEEPHVFATPDRLTACIFAFKNSGCRSVLTTDDGPLVVFDGSPPQPDAMGFVYEVPPAGFEQTIRRGQPSGKWAAVESAMPLVADADEPGTRGILLGEPVCRVTIGDLVDQERLRVYGLTDLADVGTYSRLARDAVHLDNVAQFIGDTINTGWLTDLTDNYRAGGPTQHFTPKV